jgi:hypothetical protein
MAVRISELDELSVDLSQLDELPIVDLSAGDTKKSHCCQFVECWH